MGAIGAAVGFGVSRGVGYLHKSVSARTEIEKFLSIKSESKSLFDETIQYPACPGDPLNPQGYLPDEQIAKIREVSSQLVNDRNGKISVNLD